MRYDAWGFLKDSYREHILSQKTKKKEIRVSGGGGKTEGKRWHMKWVMPRDVKESPCLWGANIKGPRQEWQFVE